MIDYLNIALIIISVLLILSVILQSKGAGLGGLTGADTGSVYTARRGVERTLFWITIILSVVFFALVLTLLILLHRSLISCGYRDPELFIISMVNSTSSLVTAVPSCQSALGRMVKL